MTFHTNPTDGSPAPGSGAREAPKKAQRREEPDRAQRSRERAAERIERSGPTNAEVLKKVAEKATEVPPREDLLEISIAAARYALTNLESARLFAEQIRAEFELSREDQVEAAAGRPSADHAASILAG